MPVLTQIQFDQAREAIRDCARDIGWSAREFAGSETYTVMVFERWTERRGGLLPSPALYRQERREVRIPVDTSTSEAIRLIRVTLAMPAKKYIPT
jgi:hypothetical protein